MPPKGVYPLDVEASSTMDSGEPGPPYPSKYVMLNNNQGNLRPPPGQRRNIPRYHHHHSSNCCLKCICCFYCFLFTLIFILVVTALCLSAIYQPGIPSYKLYIFKVNDFSIQTDFSLRIEFTVTVKVENPNEHIGFIYGQENSVVVSYQDKSLCSGKLPAFHQPGKNVSIINVVVQGKREFGSGLHEGLMKNQDSGRIPLLVIVKTPVSVVLGNFRLRRVTVLVTCSLVLDSLAVNKKIKILSSDYDYRLDFGN